MKQLDKDHILASTQNTEYTLELFESIGSTNDYLATLTPGRLPRFCVAEQQTQGRGRLGRNWYSPLGQNVYLSCQYPFQKNIASLAGLSLVVGLAVINILKHYLPSAELKAKWPNDIVYENKKLAGILLNVQAESNGFCSAIVGIGLNVNMIEDIENHIAQSWTSMRKIVGNYVNRNDVCILLIDSLLKYLKRFADIGLSGFMQEWQEVDSLFGKKVNIKSMTGSVTGIARGIDSLGQLLLESSSGVVSAFSTG
ncbi:MAG: biotin--[acetyl-CoA-carboxylase] ligase, partial [Patescibacteria group bacterium]